MSHTSLTVEDLRDIQAGPVATIPTKSKTFFFFGIKNSVEFRDKFKAGILQSITSSYQARESRRFVLQEKATNNHCEVLSTTVGFSSKGLEKLGREKDIGDEAFAEGQFNRAKEHLADDLDKYRDEFRSDSDLHGVFIITGCCSDAVGKETDRIEGVLGDSIVRVFKRECNARPGKDLKDLNHLGWHDGFSSTFVKFEDDCDREPKRFPYPGQVTVNPGVLIMGKEGDANWQNRPSWAKHGSLIAYRDLQLYVFEFEKFLEETVKALHPLKYSRQQDSDSQLKKDVEFLGARMNGRWKSGAPIVIFPTDDDQAVGKDGSLNNNFRDYPVDQSYCPFAAHTRKTGPRSDLPPDEVEKHAILRDGLSYGKEKTQEEESKRQTIEDRGLAFACYQSSLEDGFEFVQKRCNNPDAPNPRVGNAKPGLDPLIGQAHREEDRKMSGYDANNLEAELSLPYFTITRGGGYFFLPSMTTLEAIVGVTDNDDGSRNHSSVLSIGDTVVNHCVVA